MEKTKPRRKNAAHFENRAPEYDAAVEEFLPTDATLNKTPFVIRDMIISKCHKLIKNVGWKNVVF